jgi:mitochondrial fission protein ELM1
LYVEMAVYGLIGDASRPRTLIASGCIRFILSLPDGAILLLPDGAGMEAGHYTHGLETMPAIWLIDAYRAGERGQVRALAEAVCSEFGASCTTLRLDYRSWAFWPHLLRQASLQGLTPAARGALIPPWPELVISSGVRNEPVCRWLRQVSRGRTRYVHVGRPWGELHSFDLLITTPQYRVPHHPNVLHNALTLHDLHGARLREAAALWQPRFAHLPRPWIGVMVGGDSGPYTLGQHAAERLLAQAEAEALRLGGSLLISTSARTRSAVNMTLTAGLLRQQVPHYLHCWDGGASENPYRGMLALCDAFIVSADSIAMLSEACASGRAVAMFDLGGMREDAAAHDLPPGAALPLPGRGGSEQPDPRITATLYAALMRYLPPILSRDISLVHRALLEQGRACWLETGALQLTAPPALAAPHESAEHTPALQAALERVGQLLQS